MCGADLFCPHVTVLVHVCFDQYGVFAVGSDWKTLTAWTGCIEHAWLLLEVYWCLR